MDTLSIIKRIELRLAELGMSKAEFYKKSGISSASYSQWNTGRYKPSEKKLINAASVLGVSADYLLTGEEKKPAIESDGGKIDEIMEIARGLSEQDMEKLIAYAQGMKAARERSDM